MCHWRVRWCIGAHDLFARGGPHDRAGPPDRGAEEWVSKQRLSQGGLRGRPRRSSLPTIRSLPSRAQQSRGGLWPEPLRLTANVSSGRVNLALRHQASASPDPIWIGNPARVHPLRWTIVPFDNAARILSAECGGFHPSRAAHSAPTGISSSSVASCWSQALA